MPSCLTAVRLISSITPVLERVIAHGRKLVQVHVAIPGSLQRHLGLVQGFVLQFNSIW
jgi:hypothetical protein